MITTSAELRAVFVSKTNQSIYIISIVHLFELLCLLMDIMPSLGKALRELKNVCVQWRHRRLILRKYCQQGICLFFVNELKDSLTMEKAVYIHLVVPSSVKLLIEESVLSSRKRIQCCGNSAGVRNIVLLGNDLILACACTIGRNQNMFLVIPAINQLKSPFALLKSGKVSTEREQTLNRRAIMPCASPRLYFCWSLYSKESSDKGSYLEGQFPHETNLILVIILLSHFTLRCFQNSNISPVTIFRGDLELSPRVKIKVWVYKKTSEEKFPTLKKYSDKAPSTDKFATHEIKVDYEYKMADDPVKVVPPEQRIKGYRYGPQVVPISSAELEAIKFKPEKSVKLLGFTSVSNILRHYYMKDVSIFIAEPGNREATLAVSALVKAMKKMNKVAILRCVWRQGQGNVVVGVLTPNESNQENIPDSFYFNVLPFAEDVREFQFRSFSGLPASCQPNQQQEEASDKLVMMLDLAQPEKPEDLRPDFTPNPVLERFHHVLELKSKKPDSDVPSLDKTLKRIIEPDPKLLLQNKAVIDEFCKLFDVKENPKIKKSTRRLWTKPSSDGDGKNAEVSLNDHGVPSFNCEGKPIVSQIGDKTPVEDFKAMMARRDGVEWVNKAMKEMKSFIYDLVENSYEGDAYCKALDCLIALRKGCIVEQEPKQFNDFLRQLCKFCQENDLASFCKFLVSKQIMLIPKTEAIDSDVMEEDAINFLVKTEPATL
ncbi:hypothetical protein Sjap_020825 [Stephania japonica]|uniref:Ku domain-containing protein n=1 Tax=Stephania japonica TaxID=461633 RepID=A0AAP0F2M5_9MAGN